ncbi:Effector of transcription [Thalictrum thalictroides]|uniref:Effector of transcription n=1 Tax=Thalictrum thalictroides TaxID=46969 RepID=A0A7J6WBI1_THATH|nr:Effector of transcription [Thalictrum thalictroides]
MGFSSLQLSRLKREECKRTKHDSVFSQWEILIGPFDWANHSLGKNGFEKYKIHNIPLSCSCPGLYELGVAAVHTDLGRDVRKLSSECVVVVYLGQADNVRTRLQHYGRAGSHLDHGKSFGEPVDDHNNLKGPGLFREIFSRGFPIVFRWASMENKKLAEETEGRLLSIFDYAWNKGGNGARRPNDIYPKLDKIISSNISSRSIPWKLHYWMKTTLWHQKKEGIKIETSSPIFEGAKLRTRMFTVKRDFNEEDPSVCGLSLDDGSVCIKKPVEGRKRCEEHKGKRNVWSSSRSKTQRKLLVSSMPLKSEPVCISSMPLKAMPVCISPMPLNADLVCTEVSMPGEKSCELYKERCVGSPQNLLLGELNNVCGVVLDEQSACKNSPAVGRKRCEKHKGMRVNEALSMSATEGNFGVCGVGLGDGEVCVSVPVHGRKRCAIHKGRRVIALQK